MHKIGDRVGAVLSASDSEKLIQFLGYGVYEGSEVPVSAAGWMSRGLIDAGIPNPKIRLDNGDVVWGCECWWGAEKEVAAWLEKFKDWKIETVRIEEIRKLVRKTEEEV